MGRAVGIVCSLVIGVLAGPLPCQGQPAAPATRTNACFEQPIVVREWPDGRAVIVDETDHTRYATDAEGDARVTRAANGDLSFVTVRGDRVTVHANNDISATIPVLKLTVRAGPVPPRACSTKEFSFSEGAFVDGRKMTGRWTGNEAARLWRRETAHPDDLAPAELRGSLTLNSLVAGELEIYDRGADLHFVARRDGYRHVERTDSSGDVVTSLESYADGREVERRELDDADVQRLGLGGRDILHPAQVTLRRADGSAARFVVAWQDGRERVLAYAASNDAPLRIRANAKPGEAEIRSWISPDGAVWWGDVTLLGADSYRIEDDLDNQSNIYNGDGTWTLKLLTHWETVEALSADIYTIATWNAPATLYTLESGPDGEVTLVDEMDAATYRTNSIDGRTRLASEPGGDAWSFIDGHGDKVTIFRTGNRIHAWEQGHGGRDELDAGGRLIRSVWSDGKTGFSGTYEPLGRARRLVRFTNASGRTFELVGTAGAERWETRDPTTGQVQRLASQTVWTDERNALVYDDGADRVTDARDGTQIRKRSTLAFADGRPVTTTEARVGIVRNGDFVEGYRLTMKLAGNAILEADLAGGDAKLHRGNDPFWREVRADGRPVDTKAWAGAIAIGEDGTLIKRGFATEADPRDPTRTRVQTRKDGGGRDVAVVAETLLTYTDGAQETQFPDGGAIKRDRDGRILWLHYPGSAERIRLYYDGNGAIDGFTAGRDHWQYEPKPGLFAASANPSPLRTTVSRIALSAAIRSAELTMHSVPVDAPDAVELRRAIDGTAIRTRTNATTAKFDPRGHVVELTVPPYRTLTIGRDTSGRIVQVDNIAGTTVADRAYGATLPAQAIRGDSLQLRGTGDDLHLGYSDGPDRRIRLWIDGGREESDRNGTVLRARDPAGVAVAVNGQPPLAGVTTVRSIVPRAREIMAYITQQGERIERSTRGGGRRFDAAGRLVATEDMWGNRIAYSYRSADTREPSAAEAPGWQVRDGQWQRGAAARAVHAMRFDRAGNLLIEFEGGPVIVQQRDTRSGRQFELQRDGGLAWSDRLGRVDRLSNLWGDGDLALLTYAGDDRVPERVAVAGKIWVRGAAGASGTYRWTPEGGGAAVERRVFDADGRFVFQDLAVTAIAARGAATNAASPPLACPASDGPAPAFAVSWTDERSGRAFSASADWHALRASRRNSLQFDTCLDATFDLVARVGRDPEGRAAIATDARSNITRFLRDPGGHLEGLMEGVRLVSERKPLADQFYFIRNGSRNLAFATVDVDTGGARTWRGRVVRRVTPEGTVEIARPDGSRTFWTPGRSLARHVFAPGSGVHEVHAADDGAIEVVHDDGTMWSNEAYSDTIAVLKADGSPELDLYQQPIVLQGRMAAAADGSLTFEDATNGALTLRRPNGATTRFVRLAGDLWSEEDRGRVIESRAALNERLRILGGAALLDANAFDVRFRPHVAGLDDSALDLGMEELTSRSLAPTAAADGRQVWRFENAEVIRTPDATVTLRIGARTWRAEPGDQRQWETLRPELAALTARTIDLDGTRVREYDPAEAAAWLAALDPSRVVSDASIATAVMRLNDAAGAANRVRAEVFLRRAALDGQLDAQRALGAADTDWLAKAAAQGDADSQFQFATLLDHRGRRSEAGPWYERAAAQGHAEAQRGVQRLRDAGVRWGEPVAAVVPPPAAPPVPAAAVPPSPAMRPAPPNAIPPPAAPRPATLGGGSAIPQALLKSAQEGDPAAQTQVGFLYFQAGDFASAREWMEKAAAQGIIPAQEMLRGLRQLP